jgi:hypothetical protein
MEEAGIHVRPEVKKFYSYFLECVKQYGSETVKGVLDKGHHGKYKLKFLKNRKDRYQMMQLLDLV